MRSTNIFLADHRTHLQRILAAAFLTAILLPLAFLIIKYEKGLARRARCRRGRDAGALRIPCRLSHGGPDPAERGARVCEHAAGEQTRHEQRLNATALQAPATIFCACLNDILDFSALDAAAFI